MKSLRKKYFYQILIIICLNNLWLQLKWEADAGFIRINGTLYQLKQCHWHSPSEHTVNDKSFDLEVHLVHQSPTGKNAVTGILYKIGEPDPFLTSVINLLSDATFTTFIDYIVDHISHVVEII